jgi:hypothetical protein
MEYGKKTFELTGIYAGPVDSPIVFPTTNATKPPQFVSANFSIDSFAAVIDNLKLNQANQISMRTSPNAATGILEYFIKDRLPAGDIDPEAVPMGVGGIKTMASTPVAGGTNYVVGDILNIGGAGTGGTAIVTTIGANGAVTGLQLGLRGKSYAIASGVATTGGSGTNCTVNITAVYLATEAHDFWGLLINATQVQLSAQYGVVAGNICTVTAPKVQIDDIKYGDRENILTNQLTLSLMPNLGNDELQYVYT